MADENQDLTMEDASSAALFEGCHFTIVPSPRLTEEHIARLAQTIQDNGGTYTKYDEAADMEKEYTHVVSTTSDFPRYHTLIERCVHVIKPLWVETCVAKGKLSNPRQFSPDPALFLNEVTVCCADIPEGDKEAIQGGMLAMGGTYVENLNKHVTHLVALSMDNDKCQLALRKRLKCHIVLPHWFDDCLKLGRKISEAPYTLPDPDVLKGTGLKSAPPYKENKDMNSATSPTPTAGLPSPSSDKVNGRQGSVFRNKAVMLGEDLQISDRLRNSIGEVVQRMGGSMTENVDDTDMFIGHYRDGEQYTSASRRSIDVGNLSWLYHMINYNTWTNPMRRLLHYPIPRNGIPGFENLRISLSNYTGLARIYLENLVKATGAEFTKTMRQDNTHLITAHTMSEKCDAAKEWGINIVNHLWLEESYAKGRAQPLTTQRYTHFPKRTNLSEVIGQISLDPTELAKYYQRPQKVPKAKTVVDAGKNKANGASASSAHTSAGDLDPQDMGSSTPHNGRASRSRDEHAARTPVMARHLDGKENETPSTSGSRGAKDRALSKLHELAPDIALYEKEKKRVGGVIHGGRRSSMEADGETEKTKANAKVKEVGSRKRTHDSDEEEVTINEEPEDTSRKTKKAKKKGGKPPVIHHMLISKDERWVDNPKKAADDKNRLREMGIIVTEDPGPVTLLCAPKIVRTRKFIAALAAAPTVVSTSYLDEALETGELPSPEDHPLVDKESEEQWNINLRLSLTRAKANRRRLLKGWTIFCTEHVKGGWETYRDIIAANGGNCYLWKGRSSMSVSRRQIDIAEGAGDEGVSQNRAEDEGDVLYLVSEPEWRDAELWDKFRKLADKFDMVPRIVSPDWILHVTMAQAVRFDERWELREDMLEPKKKK